MNDSLLMILVISPGFIGIATSKLFTGDPTNEPISQSVLKYFLYSTSAWMTASLFNDGKVINAIIANKMVEDGVIRMNASDFLPPICWAIAFGASWSLFVKKLLLYTANKINQIFGKNKVFLENRLMNRMIADNGYHYAEILKDGESIAKGYVEDYSGSEKAIIIGCEDEYMGKKEDEIELKRLIYLESGLVVREFKYADKPTSPND